MIAGPVKTLQLHYLMIQFLNTCTNLYYVCISHNQMQSQQAIHRFTSSSADKFQISHSKFFCVCVCVVVVSLK